MFGEKALGMKGKFHCLRRGSDAMKGSFIPLRAATVRLGLQPVGMAMWHDGFMAMGALIFPFAVYKILRHLSTS